MKIFAAIAWGSVLLSACASGPSLSPSSVSSSIDANFRLRRIEAQTASAQLPSPGVRAYQKWLSQTLASHCSYYPSDSSYNILLAKRCGPLKATFKSMSRFILENDSPSLGRPLLSMGPKIYYEDLPDDCSL